MVTVFLAKAMICFMSACHPVIVGESTIPGEYKIVERVKYDTSIVGPDVLQYDEDDQYVYSIHRSISPRRDRLLESSTAEDRRTVSKGCINVQPEVYNELMACKACRTLRIAE